MYYDDNFETVDEVLNAINETMKEKEEMHNAVTTDSYNRYIFGNDDTASDDISEIVDTLEQMIEAITVSRHQVI